MKYSARNALVTRMNDKQQEVTWPWEVSLSFWEGFSAKGERSPINFGRNAGCKSSVVSFGEWKKSQSALITDGDTSDSDSDEKNKEEASDESGIQVRHTATSSTPIDQPSYKCEDFTRHPGKQNRDDPSLSKHAIKRNSVSQESLHRRHKTDPKEWCLDDRPKETASFHGPEYHRKRNGETDNHWRSFQTSDLEGQIKDFKPGSILDTGRRRNRHSACSESLFDKPDNTREIKVSQCPRGADSRQPHTEDSRSHHKDDINDRMKRYSNRVSLENEEADLQYSYYMDFVKNQRGTEKLDKTQKESSDLKTQEEALRTTQLVYSYQAGKMVPKLREPRQLYGFNSTEMGPQQLARWPAELQVINERIKHIAYVPDFPEPFYKQTGMERTPLCKSALGEGRVVYHYEPIGTFFLRSRVGGNRGGCGQVGVTLEGQDDKTLLFESRFESANLAKAVQVAPFEYELWLRNDLYTNKHTQWFYFQVKNTRPNVSYRFTIVNLMKPDSLYNHGMRPLMYSERQAEEKGMGWIRGGSDIKYFRNNVKYALGKTEKNFYSLAWSVQFTHERDTVYFAHCYPYTYSDLQDYLGEISQDPVKSKLCKQRVLCRSLAGNMVYLLNITSPTKNGDDNKHKKAVIVTSRVHPGESNASWMMKGFLDYLLSNSPDARLLRDTFIFKIVPMLNPDGVIVGNYRCSLSGRDLNRNYKSVLKDSFPTIYHTRLMIQKVLEEREIILYCDLHGHSRKQNVFIYGCENRGNPQRRLRECIFPVMLSRNAPDKFTYDSCKFKIQKSKEGTGRIVMWNMGIMNSYTLEATFAGSTLGKRKGTHFHSSDLEAMGYHFCDTLLDYCDPDNTKAANLLLELEERLRQDILQHLKLREGAEINGDININLDQEFSSDLESSDGGSDSSESDGLPLHLQYIAEKKLSKKKRLKTRKERDKHKCTGGMGEQRKSATTPAATQTSESDKKEKHSGKSSKGGRKSADGRSSGGLPVFSQERADAREAKKNDGYLEALTNAYLKNGLLTPDNEKAIPHFRYTGTGNALDNTPINLQTVCPHHDQAFTPQFLASHMKNFHYPGAEAVMGRLQQQQSQRSIPLEQKMQADAVSKILSLTNINTHTLSDDIDASPKYRVQSKPAKSETLLHQVAAPEKTYDLKQGGHCLQESIGVENLVVKQHPPPFDLNLKREKALDIQGSSRDGRRSRVGSATPSVSLTNMNTNQHVSTMDISEGLDSVVLSATQDPPVFRPVSGVQGHLRRQSSSKNIAERPSSTRGRNSQSVLPETPFIPGVGHHVNHSQPSANQPAPANQAAKPSLMQQDSMTFRHPGPTSALNGQVVPRRLSHSNRTVSQSNLHSNTGNLGNASNHNNHIERRLPHRNSNEQSMMGRRSSRQHRNPPAEITDTIRSIQQIRDSLLDPASRTNISPTTGQFIDHFIRKTDQEISAITAEYSDTVYEEDECSSDSSRHQVQAPISPAKVGGFFAPNIQQQSVAQKQGRGVTRGLTRTQTMQNMVHVIQNIDNANIVNDNSGRITLLRTDNNNRLMPDIHTEFTSPRYQNTRQQELTILKTQTVTRPVVPPQAQTDTRPTVQLSSSGTQMANPPVKSNRDQHSISMVNMDQLLGDVQSASQKSHSKRKPLNTKSLLPDDITDDEDDYDSATVISSTQRLSVSSSQPKKLVSSPAKISLLMMNHHPQRDTSANNQLQPLTRVIRHPSSRNFRKP